MSPLDWGLGHASRCVPIIRLLLEKGCKVTVGTSGGAATFLKNEFSELDHIHLEGYNIRYPSNGKMGMSMARQVPSILRAIKKEHRLLDKLIDSHQIDAVISDNRFGMWSKKVPAIYITHQVMIKAPSNFPFAESLLYNIHKRYINNFTECWIPDDEEVPGLSGDLAHQNHPGIPSFFIGPQSRFKRQGKTSSEKKYPLLFIISGPEPQRSIFEQKILGQLRTSNLRALILRGRPEEGKRVRHDGNIEIYPHMDTADMLNAILSSELIICRSGYSSIMDLAILGIPAVLVPTPGQTEQEYLARLHLKEGNYYSVSQDDLDLNDIAHTAKKFTGLHLSNNNEILSERIRQLIDSLD